MRSKRRWFSEALSFSPARSFSEALWLAAVVVACGGAEPTAPASAGSEAAPPSTAGVEPAGNLPAMPDPGAAAVETAAPETAAPKETPSQGADGAGRDDVRAADVALDTGASPGGGVAPSSEGNATGEPTPGGTRPAVDPASLPAVTLHLAGDSTVMTYAADSAQEGWGQELGQFFIDKLAIDNQAIGGASVQTFHDGSRWQRIMSGLKRGDFVMAAFGANDSGSVAGRHVEPAAFQGLFGQMAEEVEAQGATFILVTPSAMQEWRAGKPGNLRLGPYVSVLQELAQQKTLPVDDLNARSLEFLGTIGQTAAMDIYIGGDKAHFTKLGATQMARFVAEELARISSPLADYLE